MVPTKKIEVTLPPDSFGINHPNNLVPMSITLKQLDELAREYKFDVDEARRFLGIEVKKRGRPAKPTVDSDDDTPKKSVGKSAPKAKETVTGSPKRSPSGYNLFVKTKGLPFSEAAKQWKQLSDSTREKWNTRARDM